VATVALIVFALAPTIPELATSGHQVIPMFASCAPAPRCCFCKNNPFLPKS
jgi:hypothetical protein